MIPRGIRNNNPMNLIKTEIRWLGKIESTDTKFEQFKTMEWGIRAGAIDLTTDMKRGYNTIESLISKFAPSNENDTENYIRTVCKSLKRKRNEKLKTDNDTLFELIKIIIRIENGYLSKLISDKKIKESIELINIKNFK